MPEGEGPFRRGKKRERERESKRKVKKKKVKSILVLVARPTGKLFRFGIYFSTIRLIFLPGAVRESRAVKKMFKK